MLDKDLLIKALEKALEQLKKSELSSDRLWLLSKAISEIEFSLYGKFYND